LRKLIHEGMEKELGMHHNRIVDSYNMEVRMLEFMSKSIVAQRKKRGLTQEELAEKLDVSPAAISKWERGISTPELSMVCKLADCFEISVDELLGRTNCLLPEEEKYNENSMKQYDLELRKSVIVKYENRVGKVNLLDELADVDDKVIQLVLRKLNNTTLLYALAGASGTVCKKILDNLSGRMVCFIDKHMEEEKFSLEKVESAQKAVVQICSLIKE